MTIQQSINELMQLAIESSDKFEMFVNYYGNVKGITVSVYPIGTDYSSASQPLYHKNIYLGVDCYNPEQMMAEMVNEVRELVESST